ncbi:MAG: DUF3575 domain-containing protein [Chitinophagales bacterium]
MRILMVFLALLTISFSNQAQETYPPKKPQTSIGFELQGYPTGLISAARTELLFNNANAINIRIGYNWLNHRDVGKHQMEKGGGVGFSIGYRRYFENEGLKGFFVGVRSDLWFNKVDWKDFKGDKSLLISGTSNVIVVQPTIEAGYKVKFADNLLSFEPNIAFGYEWNAKTKGNITYADQTVNYREEIFETGEGIIFLLGFSFMVHLGK